MNPPYMCGDCLCRVCARNECGDNYAKGVDNDCLGCNGCNGTVDLLEDCPKEAFVPDEEIKENDDLNRRIKPMRDPNRIDNFCRMLAYYWHRVPDWRFGQLISNVLGAYQEETHKDIFFPEDHEFLEFFDKYFSMEGSSPYVSGNEEKK